MRRLGFEPSFHLTTGTFNLIVKDLIRTPPERRSSGVPAETGTPRNLLSPCRFGQQRRTFQTYRDLLLFVNPEPLILLVPFDLSDRTFVSSGQITLTTAFRCSLNQPA